VPLFRRHKNPRARARAPPPRRQHKLPLARPATQSLAVVLIGPWFLFPGACMNTSRHTCRRARLSPFVVSGS
jgi:hypothetical protein